MGGGPDKSEQRTSLTTELAQTNFLVCADGYDVLPRVAHLLKGSNCVQTRTAGQDLGGKRKPGVGLKRAHREIVDTWAMPCLDGCSCKRGANTQWAAERAGGEGGGGGGAPKSTRGHAPELQSHRKMFLSMLAEMKCRPTERGESLAQPGTREGCRQGAQLDSNPAPSGSHAQAVTLSVCLLKVLTHSPVLTWQRWGALTWGLGLHQCLARWGLARGSRLPELEQPVVAASEQLRVVRTPCHERK